MADRSTARAFGKVFSILAKKPTKERKEIAREIAKELSNCDFSNYQMEADEALIKLGLARIGVNPKYPMDGEVVIYEFK